MREIFAIPLIIVLDQVSKYFVSASGLASSCNIGFAFGIFPFSNIISTILIILILALVGILFFRQANSNDVKRLALALILGGGFSNLIDRLVRGCVVDFVKWPVFTNLPAFNLADAAITVGVILLIYNFLFKQK